MKKIVLLLTGVFVCSIYFNSCQKSEVGLDNDLNSSELNHQISDVNSSDPHFINMQYQNLRGTWDVECSGECACALEWDLNSNLFYCTCSPCAMRIEYNEENSSGHLSDESLFNNYDFTKLISSELKNRGFNNKVRLKLIRHELTDQYRLSVAQYWEANELKSFAVYENYSNRGKQYIVDCYGECECLEQFNPATGLVSCSCSECEMKITEVDD